MVVINLITFNGALKVLCLQLLSSPLRDLATHEMERILFRDGVLPLNSIFLGRQLHMNPTHVE